MARVKKTAEPIEESIRLSSGVTIIVRAAPDVYDTLDIQRVGGVVTVALPGATLRSVQFAPVQQIGPSGEYVPPARTDIADLRAQLEAQFPGGAVGPVAQAARIVSPTALGLPADPLGLNGAAATGGDFTGRSNEDEPDA